MHHQPVTIPPLNTFISECFGSVRKVQDDINAWKSSSNTAVAESIQVTMTVFSNSSEVAMTDFPRSVEEGIYSELLGGKRRYDDLTLNKLSENATRNQNGHDKDLILHNINQTKTLDGSCRRLLVELECWGDVY